MTDNCTNFTAPNYTLSLCLLLTPHHTLYITSQSSLFLRTRPSSLFPPLFATLSLPPSLCPPLSSPSLSHSLFPFYEGSKGGEWPILPLSCHISTVYNRVATQTICVFNIFPWCHVQKYPPLLHRRTSRWHPFFVPRIKPALGWSEFY